MVFLLCASISFAQVDKKKLKRTKLKKHSVVIDAAQVPDAVKKAQTSQFPSVNNVVWRESVRGKKENSKQTYIAVFKENDIKVKATYNPEGTAKKTYYQLTAGQVPANIVSNVNATYPGFTLKKGIKINVKTKSRIIYRLVLRKPSAKLILYVDENGSDAKKVEEVDESIDEPEMDEIGDE